MVVFRLLHRLFHRVTSRHPEPQQDPQHPPQQPTSPPHPPSNTVPNWSRAVLESTGIDTSTCQVSGSTSNPKYLPILPPDYRSVLPTDADDASPTCCPGRKRAINPQLQSRFFARLPLELRQLIYIYAFGNRRIHIDYDFHPRRARWRWWHRVCDDPQHCPDKKDPFVCPEYAGAEEAMLELGSSAWVKPEFEYKMHALGWMLCCWEAYRECLPILYRSNCFVLTHGIDQLFRISRIMPPPHLAMITSLSIEIDIYRASKGPPDMEDNFHAFYESFFEIFHRCLPSLKNLRLSIAGLPNRGQRDVQWSEEGEWKWIGPWENLARSREWKRLEIAVPRTWIQDFREVVERRSTLDDGSRYTLVMGVDLYPRGW